MNEALEKAGRRLDDAASIYNQVSQLETAHLDPLERPAMLVLHCAGPDADTSSHLTGSPARMAYMLGLLAVANPEWFIILETALQAARLNG